MIQNKNIPEFWIRLVQLIILISFFQIPVHLWFAKLVTIGSYKISIAEFIFYFFYIFLIKKFITHSIDRLLNNYYFIYLLLFLIVYIMSSIVAVDLKLAINGFIVYLSYVILFFIVYDSHNNFTTIESTMKILIFCGIILGLYALYIQFFEEKSMLPVVSTYRVNIFYDTTVYHFMGKEYYGLTIPGINPNTYAIQCTILLFFSLYFLNQSSKEINKYFIYLGSLLFFFINILLTLSRGALFCSIIGFLFLLKRKWFKNYKLILSMFAIFFILYFSGNIKEILFLRYKGGFYSLIGKPIEDNVLGAHAVVRLKVVLNSLQLFMKNPILGVGIYNSPLYEKSIWGGGEHNTYIKILAETGLLGFSIFILFLFKLLKGSLLILNKISKFKLKALRMLELFIAVILLFLVHLFFGPPSHYFWISIALLASVDKVIKKYTNLYILRCA